MEMGYQSGFWKIISSFGQIMLLFWSLEAIGETGKVVISMAGEIETLTYVSHDRLKSKDCPSIQTSSLEQ